MELKVLKGRAIREYIPQIAALRIEVFREYPFLYEGDHAYEERYLEKFSSIDEAILVLAIEGEEVVGVSTGYPFTRESPELQGVLIGSGRNPMEYFCYGESVIRKSFRGQGIGSQFYTLREAHARALGYKKICFYTSMRPKSDPNPPADFQPLDAFWQRRGFVEHPELVGSVSYQEIGEPTETPKQMVFWIKSRP